MDSSRLAHTLYTAKENMRENTLLTVNPNYQTQLERRGIPERNRLANRREIKRLSRPLDALQGDPMEHHLARHDALYIDPYLWEFKRGELRPDGSRKLKIEVSEGVDFRDWTRVESGGLFNGTDSEVYNTMRGYKHSRNKIYGLGKGKGECQTGAWDVADVLMNGRTGLTPAPIRRIPQIAVRNVLVDGPMRSLKRAAKTSAILVSNEGGLKGYDHNVNQAMENLRMSGKRNDWF